MLLAGAVVVVSYIAFAAYGAAIVVGFMAGRWLLRRAQPAWAEQPIVPLMLGLVLYVVVRAIPSKPSSSCLGSAHQTIVRQ